MLWFFFRYLCIHADVFCCVENMHNEGMLLPFGMQEFSGFYLTFIVYFIAGIVLRKELLGISLANSLELQHMLSWDRKPKRLFLRL